MDGHSDTQRACSSMAVRRLSKVSLALALYHSSSKARIMNNYKMKSTVALNRPDFTRPSLTKLENSSINMLNCSHLKVRP